MRLKQRASFGGITFLAIVSVIFFQNCSSSFQTEKESGVQFLNSASLLDPTSLALMKELEGRAMASASSIGTASSSTGNLSCIPSGDEQAIVARINSGAMDIILCKDAVISVKKKITLKKAGQKIYTEGLPTDSHRATLQVADAGVTIILEGYLSNIEIRNLIFDGNRRTYGFRGPSNENAAIIGLGGDVSGIIVQNVKAFDTRAWSTISFHGGSGHDKGAGCERATIMNNEFGPAGQMNEQVGDWADGISLACRKSLVKNNLIVDATDGAIVIFDSPGSVVVDNYIKQTERVAFGGIAMVDIAAFNGDYTGTVVSGNTIEATGGFIKVGVAMGPAVWFGCWEQGGQVVKNLNVTTGGVVKNNLIKGNRIGYGFAASGVRNFEISNNQSEATYAGVPSEARCHGGTNAAPGDFIVTGNNATGSFQSGFKDGLLADAIWLKPASVPLPPVVSSGTQYSEVIKKEFESILPECLTNEKQAYWEAWFGRGGAMADFTTTLKNEASTRPPCLRTENTPVSDYQTRMNQIQLDVYNNFNVYLPGCWTPDKQTYWESWFLRGGTFNDFIYTLQLEASKTPPCLRR